MHSIHLRLLILLLGLFIGMPGLALASATGACPPSDPIEAPAGAANRLSATLRIGVPAAQGDDALILYLQDPIAERITVRGTDARGCSWQHASGRNLPFDQREVPSPFPNVKLPADAAGTTVEVLIEDRKTIRPWLKIETESRFIRDNIQLWMFIAGHTAIMAVILIIALSFDASRRNRRTQAYIGYIAALLLWTLQNFSAGIAWLPFWPDAAYFPVMQAISLATVVAGIGLTILYFLDPVRWLRHLIEAGVAASSLAFLSSAWFSYGYRTGAAILAVLAVLTALSLVQRHRHADLSMRLFALGLVAIMVGGGVQSASVIFSSSFNALAVYAFPTGNLVQSALWLAALGLRSRRDRRVRALAEQANRAKTRFLAAASHDLRQPLQAMGLFLSSLEHTRLDGEQSRIVHKLGRSVGTLRGLLDQLLDVSRLDLGATRAAPALCYPEQLLGDIETLFIDRARARQLRFNLYLSRHCPTLYIDLRLTEILLRNLVDNALKYTEHGGLLIAIRRRGDRALIQVWDSGIGIAEEDRENIFDEYVQVGNAERDPNRGSGLGLSIVRRLARILNTEIHCRSRPGVGSLFEFSVPLAAPGGLPR